MSMSNAQHKGQPQSVTEHRSQASRLSNRAKLVKRADKICSMYDMAWNPPATWPFSGRQEYFVWARQIVDGVRVNQSGQVLFLANCRRGGETAAKSVNVVNMVNVVNTETAQTQFVLPLSLATQRAMWRESVSSSLPFGLGPIGLTSRMLHQELARKSGPFVFMVSIAPEHLPAYEFPSCDAW